MDELKKLVQELEQEKEKKRNELYWGCKFLIDDLTKLMQRMEEGAMINEFGVVQGKGSVVDALCAQYDMVQRHLDSVRGVSMGQVK
jgi:hypothetical protein